MPISVTVLGLGNVLLSDEGVGVRLMERVRDARPWPPEVEFVDGGAGGLNLLNVIERAERLVVFDAADMGLQPGQCRVIAPDQFAEESPQRRISLHDVSFAETLDLCGRFFRKPDTIKVLAIQPATIDYGLQLSDAIDAAMPNLVAAAMGLIDEVRSART